MAPIKSMVLDMLERKQPSRDIYFFFGARKVNDIYYADLFNSIAEKIPPFHFIPAISEPSSDDWQGEKGLITDVVDDFFTKTE